MKYKIKLVEVTDAGYDSLLTELELEKDDFWKLILEILKMRLTTKIDEK